MKIRLQKLENFGMVRPFNFPHYSQSCQFSYLSFDIHISISQFLFPILVIRKFGHSTFERS